MRVLHVIPSLSPLRGGPSFALPAMAHGLIRAGLEVHLATTDDDGPGHVQVTLGQPVSDNGVNIWYFRRQTHFYTASWPLTVWLAKNVQYYDIVHIHALFTYSSIPASWYAARSGIPYIVRPLGTLNKWGMSNRRPRLKQLSFRMVERRILEHAAAIHYTSKQEQLEAATLGVVNHSVIIAPGIDVEISQPPPSTEWLETRAPQLAGRTVILFLSRLDAKKGLDILLPAFAALRTHEPKIALVLAGDGHPEYVADLRRTCTMLGIDNDVYWAGFLDGDEKRAAMQAADLFVLPSYSENFGIAAVEALSAGLPVVISDQVAISGEIAQACAGLIVQCDVKSLLEALQQLVSNPERRRKMGNHGRVLAHEHYSIQATTRDLVRLYDDVLGKSRSS